MTREEIIAAHPLVDYCEACGLELKREGKSYKRLCPLHDEDSPSFSVDVECNLWHCFGCGEGGSVIDLHAMLRGLTIGEAMRELSNGEASAEVEHVQVLRSGPKAERRRVEPPRALKWDREIAQRVADSRGLHITACEFGFLWLKTLAFTRWRNYKAQLAFARECEHECWMLGDRSRRCIEARRIDRGPFPNGNKAHTLEGSDKHWPVGVLPGGFEESWLKEHCHKLLLVEGAPDYLAACQIIVAQDENILPVAILGASNGIAIDALHHFAQRETTIVAHPDDEGRAAAARWAGQIQRAGWRVKIFNLNQNKGDLCGIVAQGATNNELRLF